MAGEEGCKLQASSGELRALSCEQTIGEDLKTRALLQLIVPAMVFFLNSL